jgi:hypothetical protein
MATNARRRIAGGETLRAVAKDLDLHETTLRLWLERLGSARVLPVTIEEPADAAAVQTGISVATPDGFLFDGLDVSSAIRIWERLR